MHSVSNISVALVIVSEFKNRVGVFSGELKWDSKHKLSTQKCFEHMQV